MIKKSLFFGNKASLTTKNLQLLVKTEERNTLIPIEDIGFIVLENPEIYISLPTIQRLIENNVAVIFCNERHLPIGMLLNLDGHHLQQELFHYQVTASEPLKKQLWQQTVKEKIGNQAKLLELIGNTEHPLHFYKSKVKSGDSDNREGVAAAYYWKNIFDFSFQRKRNGVFPNLFLNYGYTILRAAVARAISASGLLNTIGIHHHNKYNAFSLADDIMEPFRPLVDAKVLYILKNFQEKELTTAIKAEFLKTLTETVYFKDKKSPLMVALATTTSSLQQCFTGNKKKIIYPKLWI